MSFRRPSCGRLARSPTLVISKPELDGRGDDYPVMAACLLCRVVFGAAGTRVL